MRLEPKFNLRFTYANQPATVIGWGSTLRTLNPDPYPATLSDTAALSPVLQKGSVTVISSKDCGMHYHSFSLSKSVLLYTKPNQFLCATSFTGQDSCEVLSSLLIDELFKFNNSFNIIRVILEDL